VTVQVNTSGAQAATVTTEHTLATVTDARVLQAFIEVQPMTNGATPDLVEIRYYDKARTGDTERLVKVWSLIGAQSELLWISPPVVSPHYYKLTLKQTQGTGRTFNWSIREPGQ
jgi:hypothetical protein